MEQSYTVAMRDYGVNWCRWYIRQNEDCTNCPIMECRFGTEIIEMHQDRTLGNMLPVRPLRVNDFLNKRQGYVWYQDDISVADNRLVGTFQFGTTGRKILKYPNMINDKQWNKS